METNDKIDSTGNDHLSGKDRRAWALIQDILLRFHTLIIFKHQTIHVPMGIPECFEFFVPQDATYTYEIIKYIEYETSGWICEPIKCDPEDKAKGRDYDYPGTQVKIHIMTFDGIAPHMPKDVVDKIVKEAVKNFELMMNRHQSDQKRKKKEEGK